MPTGWGEKATKNFLDQIARITGLRSTSKGRDGADDERSRDAQVSGDTPESREEDHNERKSKKVSRLAIH